MPIVVHLTGRRNEKAIRRAGIRKDRQRGVVYLMPVTENFLVSHQWLRELKRGGDREMIGVYLRLPSTEPVWAGRYSEEHRLTTLGAAMRELRALPDPLGFELFVQRRIAPAEIQTFRTLPQGLGWRYQPHAHGKHLCGCPACIPRGTFGSRALRDRLDPAMPRPGLPELIARLAAAENDNELTFALWDLRAKRRRMDPVFLAPLLASTNVEVLEDLVITLGYFRHPGARELLARLAGSDNADIAAAASAALGRGGPGQGPSDPHA